MPYIRIETSESMESDVRTEILKAASAMIAAEIGKPEQYVMAQIGDGYFLMSGEEGPTAFAAVRSIGGLNREVNSAISDKLCDLLNDKLGIPKNRIYISFGSAEAINWGWNGNTFG